MKQAYTIIGTILILVVFVTSLAKAGETAGKTASDLDLKIYQEDLRHLCVLINANGTVVELDQAKEFLSALPLQRLIYLYNGSANLRRLASLELDEMKARGIKCQPELADYVTSKLTKKRHNVDVLKFSVLFGAWMLCQQELTYRGELK